MFKSRCLLNGISLYQLIKLTDPVNSVNVKGWATNVQKFGRFFFVKITDRTNSSRIQAVVPRELLRQPLNAGSAVNLSGNWVPSQGNQQVMELMVQRCEFIGYNQEPNLPSDNDLLRQKMHLRPKDEAFAAVLRLRSHLTTLSHQFFTEKNFFHVDPPVLSRNDCEGAGEIFSVKGKNEKDFFGEQDVYLSVSSQLHLEAICSGIPNVYTIASAFRADKNHTRQHLAEFRMLEAECAFVDSVDEICDLVESYLRYISTRLTRYEDDLKMSETLCKRKKHLLEYFSRDKPIPRISHADAMRILDTSGKLREEKLSKADELLLVEKFGGPLFVTSFPSKMKPFYMKRTEDGIFAMNFDLLAPFVGELAGGSVREDDFEKVAAFAQPTSTPSTVGEPDRDSALGWYAQLRQTGYPRSSGFGIGMERLMQSLFGLENVRDTLAFPRWYRHCKY